MSDSKQGLRPRKIPMRQCLGCNEHKPKRELVRVVRSPEGEVTLDPTGKKSGRGAYICRDIACFKKIRKSGRLSKNLACEIPAEVYDRLEAELSDLPEAPAEADA